MIDDVLEVKQELEKYLLLITPKHIKLYKPKMIGLIRVSEDVKVNGNYIIQLLSEGNSYFILEINLCYIVDSYTVKHINDDFSDLLQLNKVINNVLKVDGFTVTKGKNIMYNSMIFETVTLACYISKVIM